MAARGFFGNEIRNPVVTTKHTAGDIRSIGGAAVKVTAILGQRAHCPVVDFSLEHMTPF
jgi:hypothetical protein